MLSLQNALQRARGLCRSGQWVGAEQLCTSILQSYPDQFDAIELLGLIAAQTQRVPQALELLGRVVAARPRDARAHNNYANVLMLLGRFEESLQSYGRALQLRPDDPDAHRNRGSVLRALGRLDEALASYGRALQLRPHYPEVHGNRASVLQALGRLEEALQSHERALQLKPDYFESHSSRGSVLQALGRLEEALQSHERALQLKPDSPVAHYNHGNALHALGRFEEALQSYERALQLKPDYFEAHSNRAGALQALGRFEEALHSYERALQLKPGSAEAYANVGVSHCLCNEPELAVVNLNRAIDMKPDYADAYLYRAYAALLTGDFAQGWADHEWRRKIPRMADQRYSDRPPWLGCESLIGKTILLHGEQGLGDTLQFCRYVVQVADLGASVLLEVPSQLASLLQNLDGVSRLLVRGEPLPAFDYHCPLMSLPLAFGTSLSTIPARVPYIVADRLKTRFWSEKLGPWTRLRVGLVWSGGFRPDQPELAPVNKRRNVSLSTLAPLRNAGISFYSLQKGQPAESELAQLTAAGWPGPELVDFAALLHDFSDTAALVENLDLVISVDTSTAHLAGALGKPVWIMNRFDSCWRWLLNRTDSPWYPTARLYRQRRPGDWAEVVESISIDLSKIALDARAGLSPP